jgi:hypothetical protein
MTPDTREARVRRLYDEVWNRGNLAVADELFTDDYQAATPGSPPGPEGEKQHAPCSAPPSPTCTSRSTRSWRKATWSPPAGPCR